MTAPTCPHETALRGLLTSLETAWRRPLATGYSEALREARRVLASGHLTVAHGEPVGSDKAQRPERFGEVTE